MNTKLYVNSNLLPLDRHADGRPSPRVFDFLKESGVSGIELVLMDDGGIEADDTVSLLMNIYRPFSETSIGRSRSD